MFSVTTLENGLRVATAEMRWMSSVSVGVWLGVGSRYEPAALNGASHFIEHLLFKGTEKRSAKEISEAVEGIGGYLNAFTSEEMTCFHARACADRLEELLDVLMDMLLNSRFNASDIRKEREVIKEEIAMYLDEPQHQVQELLNETLWPDQPLGRPITGTAATLDAIGRRQLLDHLDANYVTSSAVIVAAGKVSHTNFLRAVRRYARQMRVGARPQFEPCADGRGQSRLRLFTKDTEQTQLALGIRACSRHDERRYALRLLNTILGENMSSRLFQVVREDRGLAYSISSSASCFADTGDLVVSAGLDTDNLEKTLRLILAELRRLAAFAVNREELRRAQDYAVGQLELGLESTDARMNWLGDQLLGYGKVFSPAEVKRRLKRVTAGQIRALAQELFRPERLNLAMVSPLKSVGPLERMMRRS